MTSFFEKDRKIYYCETEEEVEELAATLSAGAEIEMNGENEFKYFIVNSNGEAKEI